MGRSPDRQLPDRARHRHPRRSFWALLILRELAFGVDRFDVLQEHLAISRRTLTERLDSLVATQIAERTPYKEPGQRTRNRYQLTVAGHEVLPLLRRRTDRGLDRLPSRHRHRRVSASPVTGPSR